MNLIAVLSNLAALLLPVAKASASTVIVPDDFAIVQEALASGADTVRVRPGTYAESPVIDRPVHLEGMPGHVSLTAISIVPNAPLGGGPVFRVDGIDFSSRCHIRNDDVGAHIIFSNSVFQDGIADSSGYIETAIIDLKQCHLIGNSTLRVDGGIYVVSSLVEGSIDVGYGDASLTVLNSTFVGTGSGTALTASGGPLKFISVKDNVFRDYTTGMWLSAERSAEVSGNVVSNCIYTGIGVSSANVTVTGNRATGCSHGINVGGTESLVVADNLTANCSTGLDVYVEGNGRIEHNQAWFCGSSGISVASAFAVEVLVANNTSCRNAGPGFDINSLFNEEAQVRVVRNVGFDNGGYGIHFRSTQFAEVACNDWYANAAGNVYGMAWSSRDMSVDPQFCDSDGGNWHLRDSSPIADADSCGQIGALGKGCSTTAVQVVSFVCVRVEGGIRTAWVLGDATLATSVWLERATSIAGPWAPPSTERSFEEKVIVEFDRSAAKEKVYWYRLMTQGAGGVSVIGQPLMVGAKEGPRFTLAPVKPNPSSGQTSVEFVVAQRAGIEISVFDVQGRMVASLARGEWPVGRHGVVWGPRDGGGSEMPGMYFVRFKYPGGEDVRSFVRSR